MTSRRPRATRSAAQFTPLNGHAECRLQVETAGQGFTEITREATAFLAETGALTGLLTLFCRHTSAALCIQENADPAVQHDLLTALDQLAPRTFPWTHDDEGPDDMPAHIRAMLGNVSLSIPVSQGRMVLGTWQGIYLAEHRDRPHQRELILTFTGQIRDFC
ncbi:secondary thiamine-phosphate synthase enzyme YjbQ [Xanthobacter sp. TB0139]|uniref:secondary thiamine-phosphate synthase enzyme YjbQ n=1 Tax=Xanthobacter sp. TB0139 TaxID=3459178 RepID=UPI004039CAB8